MIQRTAWLTLVAALALLVCAPAVADDPPAPADDPPAPDPPPPPATPVVVVVPPARPPQPEAFRAERVDVGTVVDVNQQLRGRCFGPGYAMRFNLVLEDDDEEDVELHAHGPQSSGRVELFELSFEADDETVEIDFADEEEEEDIGIEEGESLQVTLLWKDGTLTLREDDDEVFDVEPDEDDLEADCHVLSWEVHEEFYVTGLEIQPIGKR